ncbi:unnamed protein product [Miscanthus lutarioriparius]|uniref:Uncharacterized protein n=1 Tax=Miscanthus lutarioriparius TaxID=422564 RepID=A0A811S3J9_9POAL|nr:unnamed protein product [Miscanthus lutarioriparius]
MAQPRLARAAETGGARPRATTAAAETRVEAIVVTVVTVLVVANVIVITRGRRRGVPVLELDDPEADKIAQRRHLVVDDFVRPQGYEVGVRAPSRNEEFALVVRILKRFGVGNVDPSTRRAENEFQILNPGESDDEVIRPCTSDGDPVLRDAIEAAKVLQHHRRGHQRACAKHQRNQRHGERVFRRLQLRGIYLYYHKEFRHGSVLFVVLRKLADSLGERALERISTELVEAAPVLTDYEHSMKQIEAELLIMQAFIAQAGAKVGDKAFDAWVDQVRDVAHEVEDTIDEYAYLAVQAVDTGSFFKRKFRQIKRFAAWQKFHSQISQVEARIQRLGEIRNRYGILAGEIDRSNKLRNPNQLFMSDSSYLTDSSEIMGHVDEIGRLTQWLLEDKQVRTLIAIFGMGGLGKTTIASSVYKNQNITRTFNCISDLSN